MQIMAYAALGGADEKLQLGTTRHPKPKYTRSLAAILPSVKYEILLSAAMANLKQGSYTESFT